MPVWGPITTTEARLIPYSVINSNTTTAARGDDGESSSGGSSGCGDDDTPAAAAAAAAAAFDGGGGGGISTAVVGSDDGPAHPPPPPSTYKSSVGGSGGDSSSLMVEYDNVFYESQMFYFNTIARTGLYDHPVHGGEGIDHCYGMFNVCLSSAASRWCWSRRWEGWGMN